MRELTIFKFCLSVLALVILKDVTGQNSLQCTFTNDANLTRGKLKALQTSEVERTIALQDEMNYSDTLSLVGVEAFPGKPHSYKHVIRVFEEDSLDQEIKAEKGIDLQRKNEGEFLAFSVEMNENEVILYTETNFASANIKWDVHSKENMPVGIVYSTHEYEIRYKGKPKKVLKADPLKFQCEIKRR